MNLDVYDRTQVAYKKLKQMVYFEKHPLTLRRRLAEFECESDFKERLKTVAKVASSINPHETPEFNKWLEQIRFDVIPKTVVGQDKPTENQGSFVSNVTSAPEHSVAKVNYMFDGPVELHLLAVLWLMIEGPAYDSMLSNHSSGSRLHAFVGNDDDNSAHLFKKYHELYTKWRDAGIEKARNLLSDDRQSVCLVGLDVQEYYYRIQLDWETFRNEIKRPVPVGRLQNLLQKQPILGAKLLKCIEEICKSYRKAIDPQLLVTHPDLPEAASCLPIGLCSSPVIANWYLKVLDDDILENIRPAYYGRYVDDILMVVVMPKPPEGPDHILSFMNKVLIDSAILKWDEQSARFEIQSRPGLFLQKQKCVLQYFDTEHSTAGLEMFQKQIEDNASDFSLLPVDGDDSPVAQVAYDLLYDGSVNKFRSVKAISENRWELAGHLAKQTQLHLLTEGPIDRVLKDELFRFFKGRNAISFWDMWERVISFFVIAGDQKAAEQFSEAMKLEILKVVFSPSDVSLTKKSKRLSAHLKMTLTTHLDLCMGMSIALTSTADDFTAPSILFWRESNLIRHHLVAVPLLNYTSYKGNLASPTGGKALSIDSNKVKNTPRYVHFDECLGFVDSDYAEIDEESAVACANEVYYQFHGADFMDVTSEIINNKDLK